MSETNNSPTESGDEWFGAEVEIEDSRAGAVAQVMESAGNGIGGSHAEGGT